MFRGQGPWPWPTVHGHGPRAMGHGRAPWAMATMEAIARALEGLGEADAAHSLDAIFLEFVRRTRAQRGEPIEGWPRGG